MSDVATTAREEIVAEVLERVAGGDSVAAVFDEHACADGWPSERTWWRWVGADEKLAQSYTAALRGRAHRNAEELVRLSDEEPPKIATQFGDKLDPAWVAWQKNRLDTRKWNLSKMLPKVYGERTILSGDDDNPIAITDVTDAKADLLRRAAASAAGSGAPGVDSGAQ